MPMWGPIECAALKRKSVPFRDRPRSQDPQLDAPQRAERPPTKRDENFAENETPENARRFFRLAPRLKTTEKQKRKKNWFKN